MSVHSKDTVDLPPRPNPRISGKRSRSPSVASLHRGSKRIPQRPGIAASNRDEERDEETIPRSFGIPSPSDMEKLRIWDETLAPMIQGGLRLMQELQRYLQIPGPIAAPIIEQAITSLLQALDSLRKVEKDEVLLGRLDRAVLPGLIGNLSWTLHLFWKRNREQEPSHQEYYASPNLARKSPVTQAPSIASDASRAYTNNTYGSERTASDSKGEADSAWWFTFEGTSDILAKEWLTSLGRSRKAMGTYVYSEQQETQLADLASMLSTMVPKGWITDHAKECDN